MKESTKFWSTTLVIPIILAVVGYGINNSLQQNQQQLDKIKFADQMITEVFDTSSVDKSMARVELLPYMVQDKEFVTTLSNIVVNYWLQKAKQAAKEGNDSVFEKIYIASKNFKQKGSVLSDSIEKNSETMNAKSAISDEQTGLHLLQMGQLANAKQEFEKVAAVYPAFRSNQDILYLLKHEVDTTNDSVAETTRILNEIKTRYAWKFHSQKNAH